VLKLARRRLDEFLGPDQQRALQARVNAAQRLAGSAALTSAEKSRKAHEHQQEALVMFVLPRVLRFIHRTGLTAGLVPLLKFFTESQTPIACHAAAMLIPVLDEDDAVRMSRAAAERPWLGQEIDWIDAPLLRRMVELAPDAWANALASVLSSSPSVLGR
jgi:hypothetical protein